MITGANRSIDLEPVTLGGGASVHDAETIAGKAQVTLDDCLDSLPEDIQVDGNLVRAGSIVTSYSLRSSAYVAR